MDYKFPEEMWGWLTYEEGAILVAAGAGRQAIEIGSYCGKSTIVLAQVCPRVVAIDWHRGDNNIGLSDTARIFLENLQKWGVLDTVIPMIGRHEVVGPLLAPKIAEMIYVDDGHYESEVRASITSVEHCAREGCVWVFHDYHLGDVKRVVREWRGSREVTEYNTVHGVAVVR
jgi:MMP 1-O-methyltransferase